MRTQYLYFEHLLTITTFFGAVLLAILGTFRFFANLPEIYTNRIVIFFFSRKPSNYTRSQTILLITQVTQRNLKFSEIATVKLLSQVAVIFELCTLPVHIMLSIIIA